MRSVNRPDNIRGMTGDADMARLGQKVGGRRDECGWSRDKAATVSGIGRQTWDDIEKGRLRAYSEKTKGGIMRALGWTRESWDRILAGGEPELSPEAGSTRMESLERRFELLEAAVTALLARLPGDPPAPPAS